MSDKTKISKAVETGAEAVEAENTVKPETETITIPLDPAGTSDSVYLCVNGRSMLVQRGVPVELPAAFAEVWRSSQRQEIAARAAQRAAAFPG